MQKGIFNQQLFCVFYKSYCFHSKNQLCFCLNLGYFSIQILKQANMNTLNYFSENKEQLCKLLIENVRFLESTLDNLPNPQPKNFQHQLAQILQFNEFILSHVDKIDQLIMDGECNNTQEYMESDFELTSCIHQMHNKLKSYPTFNSLDMLSSKKILKKQINNLMEKIYTFDDEFGSNIKLPLNKISAIGLDRYQYLHLALLHFAEKNKQLTALKAPKRALAV